MNAMSMRSLILETLNLSLPDLDLTDVSCDSSPDVKALAYSQMHGVIDELQKVLVSVKIKYNSLSDIMRLPPEILSRIFLQTAYMLHDDPKKTWIYVSHVCSRWRQVALETPRLWNRIDSNSPEWITMLLSRSGTIPLDVHIKLRSRRDTNTLGVISHITSEAQGCNHLLLPHMHRFQTLSILESDLWCSIDNIRELLETPAPLLQQVVIHKEVPSFFDLFAGHAPQLRTLEVWGFTLPTNSPAIVNLTNLSLRSLHGRGCLDSLVDALALMPHLQTLALRDVRDPAHLQGIVTVPSRPAIHIPDLRCLQLHTDIGICAAFLQRITYPKTTVARITPIDGDDEVLWNTLGAVLKTRIDPIRFLRLFKNSDTYDVTIEAWPEYARTAGHLWDPGLPCTLNLQILSQVEEWDEWDFPHQALKLLPIYGLEVLHVTGKFMSRFAWCSVFGEIETLHTVRVVGDVRPLLDALQEGCGVMGGEYSEKFYLKALRVLASEGWLEAWEDIAHVTCFAERRRRGAGLRELYILDDWSPQDAVLVPIEELRVVVDKLYVGGGNPPVTLSAEGESESLDENLGSESSIMTEV